MLYVCVFLGESQLENLKKEVVLGRIPSLVPKEWYQVQVVHLAAGHPHIHWLQVLWDYLRHHMPHDLAMLSGLPILALPAEGEDIEVVPLAIPSTVIVASAMGSELSDSLQTSLQVLGVKVIKDCLPYVRSHAAVMGNYVRLPLPEDVLLAIVTVCKTKTTSVIQDFVSRTSQDDKRELRNILSKVNPKMIGESHKAFLRTLPIFDVVKSGSDEVAELVCVESVGKGAPSSMPPICIKEKLLDLSQHDSKVLAELLGVKVVSTSELLSTIVFAELVSGGIQHENMDTTVQYVIENLPKLMKEDPGFVDHLTKLPFVPKSTGEYVKPCDVFDSESEFLQKFFYGENMFPSGKYTESHQLMFLRQLGLQDERSISALHVVRSVVKIEELVKAGEDKPKAEEKAQAVLKFLNKKPNILTVVLRDKTLASWLTNIAWLPTLRERPPLYPETLEWFKSSHFAKPKDVKTLGWFPLVGAVAPLTQENVCSELANTFGWNSPPSLRLVIDQLQKVTHAYEAKHKAKFLAVITGIYDHMFSCDMQQLQEILIQKNMSDWVWYGEGFTSTDKIVTQKLSLDLQPYLFPLPSEILLYKTVFEQCGAKASCDSEAMVQVLQAIQSKYARETFTNSENVPTDSTAKDVDTDSTSDVPTNNMTEDVPTDSITQDVPTISKNIIQNSYSEDIQRDRQLAIDILNILKTGMKEMADQLRSQVVIPVQVAEDTTLRMLPIIECTYCDTEWLRKGFNLLEFDEQDGIVFIHDMMPVSSAEALGVPTLMSRMLHAEELSVTGFGQTEPLTTRLHRILEDYTDGFAVPKELIQNADDSGATVFKLLYDERTNTDCNKYLIDEGMKECHGPALWAYNNAVFTDQDFENITKLGGATKERQVDKIGKFGLGFNAVYNLTDVPSFISRNFLVIFDPHTSHVGRGIKDRTKPGIKIDMKKNRILIRKLPDQFKPYQDVFGCSINGDGENHFEGTLFRLPLRTKQQASESEISSLHYDKEEMVELLKLFVRGAQNLLLFTQNVNTLQLYHIASDEKDPNNAQKIFEIRKEHAHTLRCIPDLQIVPPHASAEAAHNFNILKAGAEYLGHMKASRRTRAPDNTLGATLVLRVATDILAESAKLLQEPLGLYEQYWMVSYVLGQEKSLVLSVGVADEGFIPIASVAVPLRQQGGSMIPVPLNEISAKGAVFCYLPLPMLTGLPVHINGSFAIQSNRRYLCERTEDDKYSPKAEWNEALLEDAVCKAYVQLLCDSKSLNADKSGVRYFELWPCITEVTSSMLPLVAKFYEECIKQKKFPVMSDGTELVTLANAVFLDPVLAEHDEIGSLAIQAFRQCQKSDSVVQMPSSILQSFAGTGHADFILAKTYSQDRFFSEIFFPNIMDFKPATRNALVLYALNQGLDDLDRILYTVPCIPVVPDGEELKCPHQLVHPGLPVAKLYGPEDGVFPYDKEFLNANALNQLLRLGMKGADLSWDDMLERAESIKAINKVDVKVAKGRLQAFMQFLDRKLTQETKDITEDEQLAFQNVSNFFRQIQFLPVLQKPQSFPMPWKGDELEPNSLQSAEELRLKEQRYLLSSTQWIVDEDGMSKQVKFFLGLLQKSIAVEHVFSQLEHALMIDPKVLDSKEAYEYLHNVCYAIYDYLQKTCKEDEAVAEFVSDELGQRPCILVDREYLAPHQVAFMCTADCSPYLYALPIDMSRKFKPLMKTLGVQEKFEVQDYVVALEKIQKESEPGEALKGKKLELSLRLVSMLNSSMKMSGLEIEDVRNLHGTIYIPNAQGVLQPSVDLCYNDCPWIPVTQSMNFTHPDITYQASAKLGVKTKRQEALTKYATGIPFGQKERLTNSLKRVLSTYPCDHEIFKELIQNADDATASEIHFIKDCRHHPEKHVFENSWRPLQGPALCVYNNKPFSNNDLEGIQRLGEGSKVNDPNKTGQYGIGFSSVYHLTDAPSLLTSGAELEETLCVFDPHCYYVPGATPSEPGIRFNNLKALRATFPDVFKCYLEDILKVENATLFRFPLRNQYMAQKSEISKSHFTIQYIQRLLEKLAKEAFEILLFTNHLTTISISDIDLVTGELVNTYTVHAELAKDDQELRDEFHQLVQTTGRQLRDGQITINDIPLKEVCYNMSITDSLGVQKKWCVTQRLGFGGDVDVPESVQRAFNSGDLALLPRGGTACLLEKRAHGQMLADNQARRVFCFLPLPVETDLPVHINGHFSLGHENRRHLWTNNDTEGYQRDWNDLLCRQVIAPSYVTLLRFIRMLGLNANFDQEVDFAQVFCSRQILDSALNTYQGYFPEYSEARPQWDNLVSAVYQAIGHQSAPLMPAVRENFNAQASPQTEASASNWQISWLPPCGTGNKKAFFTKLEKTEPSEEQASFFGKFKSLFRSSAPMPQKSDAQILKEVLLDCGFKILEANSNLASNFLRAGVLIDFMSPEGVVLFFQSYASEYPMCEIGTVPLPVPLQQTPFRDEKTLKIVLSYCKDSPQFLTSLSGMPLLLTSDEKLHVFDKDNPVFFTDHHDLILECAGMFLHKSLKADIFKDIKTTDVDVFKSFDIEAFTEILHHKLPQETFCQTQNLLPWRKSIRSVPSETWVRKAWMFIRSEEEDLLKMKDLEKEEIVMRLFEIKIRLEPLESWCLLPTRTPNANYLYPVGKAEEVIDLRNIDYKYYNVRDIIRKLQLPELDSGALNAESTRNSDFVHLLVTTLEKPALVLAALHKAFSVNQSTIELSKFESDKILQYFSDNVDQLKDKEETIEQLLALPFYTTIHGDLIKLTGCLVYTLPAKIPTDDIDVWQSKSGTVFLETNDILLPLYAHLGCATISVLDVYCTFILQHFEYLSPEARTVHLKHIYKEYLRDDAPSNIANDDRTKLLDSLKNLSFIGDKEGELHQASDFYDPETVLFRVMLPEEKLPPRAGTLFRESEWLSFLRKLGLKSEVTKDIFLEFAHQVAHEGKDTSSMSALTKSKVMTQHLFSMDSRERGKMLEDISEIPFVAPEKVSSELSSMYLQYGDCGDGKLPYVSFSNSYSKDYQDLVWSEAPVLPTWADPLKQSQLPTAERMVVMECLQMSKRPPNHRVVRHLTTLCNHLKEFPSDTHDNYLKRRVFKHIYEYLQENSMDDAESKAILENLPCVLVTGVNHLAKPCNTVINMLDSDEIQPYLFKVPTELGEFHRLFVYLGATEVPTVDQYASVLERMHQELGINFLLPNELTVAFKAIKGVFTCVENCSAKDVKTKTLYLCSEAGRLIDTSMLVFNDAPSFYDRVHEFGMQFLFDLKECGIRYRNFEDLVEKLPVHLQPGMLSAFVKEILVDKSKKSVHTSGTAAMLNSRLTSEKFMQAMARLARHESHKRSKKLDEHSMFGVLDRLSTIKVYSADPLTTHLIFRDKPIKGSELDKTCFVERVRNVSGPDIWNVFIKNNSDMDQDLLIPLAEVVNTILSGMLRDSVLFLLPILTCSEEKIQSKLDNMNVRLDHSQNTTKMPTMPSPGTHVPEMLKQWVQEVCGGTFTAGEYVAYKETENSKPVYVVVTASLWDDDYAESTPSKYLVDISREQTAIIVRPGQLHKIIRS